VNNIVLVSIILSIGILTPFWVNWKNNITRGHCIV